MNDLVIFRRVITIAFIGLLTGCMKPAHAPKTIHVDSLSSLQRAIDHSSRGQTIVIDNGVYHQSRPITIRGQQDLTITGATRDFADTVLHGPGMNDARLESNIRVDDSDRITLKYFTVRDSHDHGVQINNDSDAFVANHLHTLDNGESGFKVTSPRHGHGAAAYSDDGLITHSLIEFTRTGQRQVVEGIDIVAGNDWHLLNNRFRNIRRADGGPAYAAFAKGNAHGTVMANNIVAHSFIGLSFGGGGTNPVFFRNGRTDSETRGGVIRNNVIYDTDDAGIYLNKASGFRVHGNTVLRNGPGTGSIESRFAASHGRIDHNHLSGPIKKRDGGRARLNDNQTIDPRTAPPRALERDR